MIRLAIVEDEDLYANQLIEFVNRFKQESNEVFNIVRFRDGDEIVERYKATYDIIFMDIQMQFMDGMAAAKRIRELDSEVIIMFITNMTNYAIMGYEVGALDYIVKPIDYFSFRKKIERAIEKVEKKRGQLLQYELSQSLYDYRLMTFIILKVIGII